MSGTLRIDRRHQHSTETNPFRLSRLAVALAGASLLSIGPLYAADKSIAELQADLVKSEAEVTRLKQAIEQQQGSAAPTAPVAATAAPADDKAAAKQDEPAALDAIVVRTRNRIERLQDVPVSISVVTGKELDRLGATDIGAITKRAANINWNYGNQRTFSLSLRGIGKQGQTEAQDPAVGLVVDGVAYSYNALASSFEFTDVDAVEVARGPQGTLLGKNASIGAVTITTKRPSFTPSADYSVSFGERDTVKGNFAAGGPIVDGLLAWRGSISASKARGDIVNAYNKDLTYTNTDRLTGRVQFLLTPSPDVTARLALDATPRAGEFTNSRTIYTPTPTTFANGTANPLSTDAATRLSRDWFTKWAGYSYAGNYLYGGANSGNSVNMDGSRPLITGSNGATADINWKVGTHTLTSITAYRDYHFDAVNDEGTPFDINRNSGGFWNDYKQVTQELRLTSPTGGLVDYQTGLYFAHVKNFNDYRKGFGNDAGAWFATPAQYSYLNTNAAGRLLMQDSLANLSLHYNTPAGIQYIDNKSQAIFGQANWHLSDPVTVTTGVRFTHENRNNTDSSAVADNGSGAALNPVSVNSVALGGFNSNATTGALGTNSTTQLNLADQLAHYYYGAAITATPGAAYNSLTAAQQKQVANAKALRAGQIGVLYNPVGAQPFQKTTPAYVLSPTYKISEDLSTYASVQHGEKAGVSQVTNGVSNPVREEKTTAYELGFKSSLLDKTLIFNADVFLMNVKDYQQTTQVLDSYTTTLKNDGTLYYTGATGNVPKVRSKGLEVDGVYAGLRNTTIRFAGAYTDARYVEFSNSPLPAEWNFTGNPYGAYRDVSGKTLAGASKWSYNVGVDYRAPVLSNKEAHTSLNIAYTSRWNSDVYLSDYAWVPGNYIVDFSVGLGARNQSYDVSLLVKNLLNDKTALTQTWNSYTPAVPRWIGVQFTGKL